MQKEVELLKLQKALTEKDGPMVSERKSNDQFSFDTVKDIVPVFDGGDNFNAWYSQVMHYREALKIDDALLVVTIRLKFKGAALAWYSAKLTVPKNVDDLLKEMKLVFASSESTLVRRLRF
ncbi:uncharacterized protein LOC110118400 [Ceratitis capitata]|uniref:uncharacterized protein LOC110118400 n=1 Tax=Ceratitis capitata TaxID=7213 RepID=UPI000A11D7AC|nr:uncharacterized protein LOC110118400 [Ceratitis capitata]